MDDYKAIDFATYVLFYSDSTFSQRVIIGGL